MGLKIPDLPDDYGVGRDCEACYDPGKTPNFVFIRFWDIEACPGNPPPPNGRTFICAQDPVIDCKFMGEIDFGGLKWRVTYMMVTLWGELVVSSINLGDVGAIYPAYFNEVGGPCAVDFMANDMLCPDAGGEGGHGHVQVIVPIIIITLTSGYHFVTTPNFLYEMQDVGMDHKLVHLADRNGKTNVLIYIDEEDMQHD